MLVKDAMHTIYGNITWHALCCSPTANIWTARLKCVRRDLWYLRLMATRVGNTLHGSVTRDITTKQYLHLVIVLRFIRLVTKLWIIIIIIFKASRNLKSLRRHCKRQDTRAHLACVCYQVSVCVTYSRVLRI